MDDDLARRARKDHGVVSSAQLGQRPSREAARHGLVVLQPRVYVATTQPIGPCEQVAAVRASARGDYAFLGWTALWLYGLTEAPLVVQVGVRHGTRLRARPPVQARRVVPAVLEGKRTVQGFCVVALEVAVLQACADADAATALALVERVLRDRRTTIPRLRARCRRGVAGSSLVRQAIDVLAGTSLDRAVRRLRAALEERGVHGLRCEVHFRSATGASAYADLLDETSRTVVEVDGYLSHAERRRFRADRRRDRWLQAEHRIVTARVDAAETLEDLDALADELAAFILTRRAQRAAAG